MKIQEHTYLLNTIGNRAGYKIKTYVQFQLIFLRQNNISPEAFKRDLEFQCFTFYYFSVVPFWTLTVGEILRNQNRIEISKMCILCILLYIIQ